MHNDIELKNPFNLEHNIKNKWLGELLPSKHPIFCEFIDAKHGLRAGFINIKNQIKEGYNTIDKLIEKYAPPIENDTKAYKEAVSKEIKKATTYKLVDTDIKDLGIAIIRHEQGRVIYTDEVINQVLREAGINENDTSSSLVSNVMRYILSTFRT